MGDQFINANVFSSEYSISSEIMLAKAAISRKDSAPSAQIMEAKSRSQNKQNANRTLKSSASVASVQWR